MYQLGKYKINLTDYPALYQQMLLIRRFEEKCGQLYGMGLIGGFCHLYIGQEAVITGINWAKNKQDNIITSYRDHAHVILSGIEPKYVMAELTGRASGCSKGKGGSMHMFNKVGNFYGGHGIVGAQVPIGTGLAFAEKYNKTDNICFTFLGDGAVNQGQVYEAFNMAALWKLPVIYVIENNQYSMGTALARSTAMTDLHKKGESFNIPGIEVDGMSLESVYDAARQLAEFVRSGNGPAIMEVKTYRYRGHSMSDPANYRSKEEVVEYKGRDPINFLKELMLEKSVISEKQLKLIEQEVKSTINATAEFATNAALPDEAELLTDIYK